MEIIVVDFFLIEMLCILYKIHYYFLSILINVYYFVYKNTEKFKHLETFYRFINDFMHWIFLLFLFFLKKFITAINNTVESYFYYSKNTVLYQIVRSVLLR